MNYFAAVYNNFQRHFLKLPYFHFLKLNRSCTAQSSSSEWKSTIGLEVHAQILVESKLFSSASSEYGLPTNSCVNLFDAAIPGTLPVLNKRAVELTVLTSLALKCKINPVSLFDRKHYFYSDLPSGYQITQQRIPIAENGEINFAVYNPVYHKKPYYKTSKIKQIQLEQDSGKSYHEIKNNETFIDLNRAGIALMEIVFEPDLDDGEEAAAVIKELCLIFKRLGSCSCKMEEGALRVDTNVSVHKDGSKLGVRTEIKNIGSVRAVANAVKYEVSRQLNMVRNGEKISNQTLSWNAIENKTVLMRAKEEVQDYRYMPEPNLPPLRVILNHEFEKFHESTTNKDFILNLSHLKDQIPMLPQDERNFLMNKYNVTDLIAYNIVNQPVLYKYFTDILSEKPSRNPKTVYNVLMVILLTSLNNAGIKLSDCTISSHYLGELTDLFHNKEITQSIGEKIVDATLNGNLSSPKKIMEEKHLTVLSEDEIKKTCLDIIEKNPRAVKDYLKGKKKILNFFINKTKEAIQSRALHVTITTIVTELLEAKRQNAGK